MGKGWTEERRKKQAETIRKNKPWEKSTGPKSEIGKKISSLNARKHGNYAQEYKDFKEALRANHEFLESFRAFNQAQHELDAIRQIIRRNGLKESLDNSIR